MSIGNNGCIEITALPHADSPRCPSIGNDAVRVEVDASRGGRVSQIRVRGVDLLVGPDSDTRDPMRWGSYPMVPWAGRIRGGRFELDGTSYQLPTVSDGHAIHGVGYVSAWEIAHRTDRSVELTLSLPSDETWPFGGRSRQRITVDDDGLLLELDVTADSLPFPATIGWHPWFRKPERLDFHPTSMYRRVDGIATTEQIEVQPGPWDDCFVNSEAITAAIAGVAVRLTSDCTDWVVYDQPAHATCIEPQSGPPDAANIRPYILRPGDSLSRWFRIDLGH